MAAPSGRSGPAHVVCRAVTVRAYGAFGTLDAMSRALVQLNIRLLGALLVIGIPLVTVTVQAALRRSVPSIVAGEHNDVAGFLIAVVAWSTP